MLFCNVAGNQSTPHDSTRRFYSRSAGNPVVSKVRRFTCTQCAMVVSVSHLWKRPGETPQRPQSSSHTTPHGGTAQEFNSNATVDHFSENLSKQQACINEPQFHRCVLFCAALWIFNSELVAVLRRDKSVCSRARQAGEFNPNRSNLTRLQ